MLRGTDISDLLLITKLFKEYKASLNPKLILRQSKTVKRTNLF
ncbi:hypothetical protein HS7_06990 [Sulfolobales archaeon HS-7]|nr:hypothetical protein HS7_06990 [Sulfolobales archaeon HS-7]